MKVRNGLIDEMALRTLRTKIRDQRDNSEMCCYWLSKSRCRCGG